MAEAENRNNESLEEKVKDDHEEKDKKERAAAEMAKSKAEPLAEDKAEPRADPGGVSPRGVATQRDRPKGKRENSAKQEPNGPEGKQRKTSELGPPPATADRAVCPEASSSSQGPRSAPTGNGQICADRNGRFQQKEYGRDLARRRRSP